MISANKTAHSPDAGSTSLLFTNPLPPTISYHYPTDTVFSTTVPHFPASTDEMLQSTHPVSSANPVAISGVATLNVPNSAHEVALSYFPDAVQKATGHFPVLSVELFDEFPDNHSVLLFFNTDTDDFSD